MREEFGRILVMSKGREFAQLVISVSEAFNSKVVLASHTSRITITYFMHMHAVSNHPS